MNPDTGMPRLEAIAHENKTQPFQFRTGVPQSSFQDTEDMASVTSKESSSMGLATTGVSTGSNGLPTSPSRDSDRLTTPAEKAKSREYAFLDSSPNSYDSNPLSDVPVDRIDSHIMDPPKVNLAGKGKSLLHDLFFNATDAWLNSQSSGSSGKPSPPKEEPTYGLAAERTPSQSVEKIISVDGPPEEPYHDNGNDDDHVWTPASHQAVGPIKNISLDNDTEVYDSDEESAEETAGQDEPGYLMEELDVSGAALSVNQPPTVVVSASFDSYDTEVYDSDEESAEETAGQDEPGNLMEELDVSGAALSVNQPSTVVVSASFDSHDKEVYDSDEESVEETAGQDEPGNLMEELDVSGAALSANQPSTVVVSASFDSHETMISTENPPEALTLNTGPVKTAPAEDALASYTAPLKEDSIRSTPVHRSIDSMGSFDSLGTSESKDSVLSIDWRKHFDRIKKDHEASWAMQSASSSSSSSMEDLIDVYVHDKTYAWVPAKVLEYRNDCALVAVMLPGEWDGSTMLNEKEESRRLSVYIHPSMKGVPKDDILSFAAEYQIPQSILRKVLYKDYIDGELPKQNLDGQGKRDMADLIHLHSAAILYNLKERHYMQTPYTRVGDIVVAMNPCTWIDDLYSTKTRDLYAQNLIWEGKDFVTSLVSLCSVTTVSSPSSFILTRSLFVLQLIKKMK
jgi:hypothetical protein